MVPNCATHYIFNYGVFQYDKNLVFTMSCNVSEVRITCIATQQQYQRLTLYINKVKTTIVRYMLESVNTIMQKASNLTFKWFKWFTWQWWIFWGVKGDMNTCAVYSTLHEKHPNTEFFIVYIFPHSVRIRENTDQKMLRMWTHFTQCNILQFERNKVL